MTGQGIRVGVSAAILRDGAILLVEFGGEWSQHFNFPGGGVERGESLHEALRREVREETGAEVAVGRLLLVWEYVPARFANKYGTTQKLGLLFHCELLAGSQPRLPPTPDPHQVGVRWVPLGDLAAVPLLPDIPALEARLAAVLQGPATADPLVDHR